MKRIVLALLLTEIVGAEEEVWYGADGKVAVVRKKEPEKETFKPMWEREVKKKKRKRYYRAPSYYYSYRRWSRPVYYHRSPYRCHYPHHGVVFRGYWGRR